MTTDHEPVGKKAVVQIGRLEPLGRSLPPSYGKDISLALQFPFFYWSLVHKLVSFGSTRLGVDK